MKRLMFYLLSVLAVCARPASVAATDAGEGVLTLAHVIELSAAIAPEVRISATRIAEGEANLAGARFRSVEDPKLDLAAGRRNGNDRSVDVEAGVEIPFESGNRRSKRVALALADVQREKHAAGDARRQAVATAVSAYYRLLHAEERSRLARDRKILAGEQLRIAGERHLSGDVAQFEVNLARTEVARTESDLSAAQGHVAQARTALARSLGRASAAGLQVAGDIKDRRVFDALLSAPLPKEREDLLAARAEVTASRAAIDLARAERMPDLAFRLGYKREGTDEIALGGITVNLPFLNPRPGPVKEALARHQRAQLAAGLRQAAISVEVEGARAVYEATVESVRWIERNGPALLQENESLAYESYRAGKINLSTLLQVRRDALETRREYLERLLEAAEAGIELASAIGIWPTTN